MLFYAFIYLGIAMYLTFGVWACSVLLLVLDKLGGIPFSTKSLAVRRALKWPALAGILLFTTGSMTLTGKLFGLEFWVGLLFLTFWWVFRNYGDDQTPPEDRKRVRARIKQIGGRLVIVPETV